MAEDKKGREIRMHQQVKYRGMRGIVTKISGRMLEIKVGGIKHDVKANAVEVV